MTEIARKQFAVLFIMHIYIWRAICYNGNVKKSRAYVQSKESGVYDMTAGEMKYRAKGKITGGWLYGEKLTDQISGTAAIVTYVNLVGDVTDLSEINIYAVYPETLGRFTMLTDINDKEIFEEDVISKKDEVYGRVLGIVRFGKHSTIYGDKETQVGFYVDWSKSKDDLLRCDIGFWAKRCEVIGNVYDNPELLKGD